MSEMALRFTCAYEGEKINVISKERLEMVTQASDALEDFDQKIGFWLELRGSQGELLYRQVLNDPFRSDVEVFQEPDEEGGAIVRAPIEKASGYLILVVPDLAQADHISLVRTEPEVDAQQLRVVEIASIPVTDHGDQDEPK
jgi:hypothetical protein